jgi:hypothetical protein
VGYDMVTKKKIKLQKVAMEDFLEKKLFVLGFSDFRYHIPE